MRGLVIKNTGSWYTVKTDDGQLIESKIKGNFRLKGIRSTNPVAVGDYVQLITNQEGTAFISSIGNSSFLLSIIVSLITKFRIHQSSATSGRHSSPRNPIPRL